MSADRIFGTDGVRGRFGEGWLTPGRVSALGRAAGVVLGRHARGSGNSSTRALLGHDGRESGPVLQEALTRGLASQGLVVHTADLITTPGLALLTRLEDYAIGAMVSASHNPAEDNGIKLFSSDGRKLSDELELEIEAELLAHPAPIEGATQLEHASAHEEAYVDYLAREAGAGLDLTGLRIGLDCAHGGGSRIGPAVLRRLGADLVEIGTGPDGLNINDGVGSTHTEALQELVRTHGLALGIALDGDGDRCMLVDEQGDLVHGDGILTVIATSGARSGEYPDPRIVATVMSNRGLHRALREVGVSVHTVGVGDRQVVEALESERLRLGGEQSGHIVFGADNHFIGDGMYTALRVLRVMRGSKKPLSQLAAPYQPFPQVLLNQVVASKPDLEGFPRVLQAVTDAERELGEDGRVLLRYSGTEPLARVMVEGPDAARIRELAEGIAALIVQELGG